MPLSKKEVEIVYLERFKALMPTFPTGAITPSESPDFLVTRTTDTLGIELTELHREALPGSVPLQGIEMMRRRIAERAHALYEEIGGPPVRCTIFMREYPIRQSEVEPIATAIANLVVRNLPSQNSSCEERYEWTNRAHFPELLNFISVHRHDVITQNFFSAPGSVWQVPLAASDIERALAAKESKCKAYRTRCDEVWLLVNADIDLMSTWIDFDPAAVSGAFKTSFDRVFLLRHFASQLHELTLIA